MRFTVSFLRHILTLAFLGGASFFLSLPVAAAPVAQPTETESGFVSPSSRLNTAFAFADNAFADDGNAALRTGTNVTQTYGGYVLAIPPGAVIEGIQVRVDAWRSIGSCPSSFNLSLSWDRGTNFTNALNTGTLGTADPQGALVLGGASNLWGRAWTASELNDGLAVRIQTANLSAGCQTALDWLPVQVFYAFPTATGTPAPTVVDTVTYTTTSTSTPTVADTATLAATTAEPTSPTATETPSETVTPPTATPDTQVPTTAPAPFETPFETVVPTPADTPVESATPAPSDVTVETVSPTPTETGTPLATQTEMNSATPTNSSTFTPILENTPTGTPSVTHLPLETSTDTAPPTGTATQTAALTPSTTPEPPQHLVITRIYGGGGTNGALFESDFIEIFNPGSTGVFLGGWSVQYASADGSNWNARTELPAMTLAPGQYLFIEEASAGESILPLPPADVKGSIAMAGAAGKVALVNSTDALTGACPSSITIADLVGYGTTASCREGKDAADNAPAPGTVIALVRRDAGCTDSNNNAADFFVATSAPRTSKFAFHYCQTTATPTNTPTASATPTATSSPTPFPSGVVINEFLPDPASDWNEIQKTKLSAEQKTRYQFRT